MREENWGRERVLEALEIQQRRPMMNIDAGLILDPSWTPFACQRTGSHVTGSAPSRGHPPWHFNLLMTTLRVETSKDEEPSSTDYIS